jgi:hypothetical protein
MATKKTAKEIQGDIIALLQGSALSSMISGGIYRAGLRPQESRAEDIVVAFISGVPDQIQRGEIHLKIYVPDIDPYANEVLFEDWQRCEALELAAEQWVESLATAASNYRIRLLQTICTEREEAVNQHFVAVKLQYEYAH